MCFSATASFVSAGALLTVGTGLAIINRSQTHKMFVIIPVLFGLQQASEGVVWLTVDHPMYLSIFHIAVIAFLLFALVLWPSWVPWSMLELETSKIRRKYILILACVGTVGSLYAAWLLLTGMPTAEILGNCVAYSFPSSSRPLPMDFYIFCYAIPTIAPFFISSLRIAKVTGWLVLSGLILTFIIRREALTSTWCFSASVISLFIALDVIYQRWPKANILSRFRLWPFGLQLAMPLKAQTSSNSPLTH